ncbi:MAG: PIN domain-containing protein [Opitutales bacterium]|nr:PIN domain-containing protein [Opitutales bacterium]
MIVPDLNCLVHAYNKQSQWNAKAEAWLTTCMEDTQPFILLPVVLFGFVRITTNPRVFEAPFSIDEIRPIVAEWLARPQVRLVETDPGDIQKALDLLKIAGTAGNLTTDAQIASVALRLDAEVHTTDMDFQRFPGLRWKNPMQ